MKQSLRRLYKRIPLKRELFSLVRRFYSPPESLYRHLYFTGPFAVPLEGRKLRLNHYGYEVENSIFWKGLRGSWEGVSMSLWIELCKTSSVILDVGANTGVYSLVAKAVNPGAAVYAFEPVERVADKLVRNCALNGYDIPCVRKAASNYDGKARIYDPSSDHIYSVTVNRNMNLPGVPTVEVEIETIRLSTFLESFGEPPAVDLMKLDVETHEPEVLEGMGPYLDRFRPAMLIEVLTAEAADRIEGLIKDMGYLYFNLDETRGPLREDRLAKSDHRNHLICAAEQARRLGLL